MKAKSRYLYIQQEGTVAELGSHLWVKFYLIKTGDLEYLENQHLTQEARRVRGESKTRRVRRYMFAI